MHSFGKDDVPDRFQLNHIATPWFKVGDYDYDKISKNNQKNLDRLESLDQLISQRIPSKILKKYAQNPKKFNNTLPVFDADIYRLTMVFILISELVQPGNADCFSCFSTILKKIHDICRDNTSLRIKLDSNDRKRRKNQNGNS